MGRLDLRFYRDSRRRGSECGGAGASGPRRSSGAGSFGRGAGCGCAPVGRRGGGDFGCGGGGCGVYAHRCDCGSCCDCGYGSSCAGLSLLRHRYPILCGASPDRNEGPVYPCRAMGALGEVRPGEEPRHLTCGESVEGECGGECAENICTAVRACRRGRWWQPAWRAGCGHTTYAACAGRARLVRRCLRARGLSHLGRQRTCVRQRHPGVQQSWRTGPRDC